MPGGPSLEYSRSGRGGGVLRGVRLDHGGRGVPPGLAAFRACIQRNLELAEYAEALIRGRPGLTLMAPATLGIVCFRREWPGCDEAETERRGTALAGELERSGTALVSTTRLAGRHAIRLCILNPTSTAGHVRSVIEHFADAAAPAAGSQAEVADLRVPGPDLLGAVPLLSGVPAAARHAVHARGVYLDVAAGQEVIRRWDSDRFSITGIAAGPWTGPGRRSWTGCEPGVMRPKARTGR